MGWADKYIEQLKEGKTVSFRPRGNSMSGKIEDGQRVTVRPFTSKYEMQNGDIVLCKVNGNQYLHLISSIMGDAVLISNNKGKKNGWTSRDKIYGKVIKIEP